MKYSVIIPIYNIEKYINQCVDSVLSQTYKNIEIILINDGSKDNSLEVCNQYKNNQNIKIISQENAGLAEARNTGIRNATGDYILFLDGDDYLLDSNCISNINSKIYSQVDILIFNHVHDYNGQIKKIKGYNSDFEYKKTIDYLEANIENGMINISACMAVYRKEFILKNDLYLKHRPISEDIDWTLNVYLQEPTIKVITDYVYVYRQNRAGSLTNSISELKIKSFYEMIAKWNTYEYKDDRFKKIYLSYNAYQYSILLSIANKKNCNKKQLKEIYENRKIIKNDLDFRVKKVNKLSKVIGLRLTVKVLKVYNTIKKIGIYKMEK